MCYYIQFRIKWTNNATLYSVSFVISTRLIIYICLKKFTNSSLLVVTVLLGASITVSILNCQKRNKDDANRNLQWVEKLPASSSNVREFPAEDILLIGLLTANRVEVLSNLIIDIAILKRNQNNYVDPSRNHVCWRQRNIIFGIRLACHWRYIFTVQYCSINL